MPSLAGGLVGFSYTEAEKRMGEITTHRNNLEDYITRLEGLKTQSLEDWNGNEEAQYQQLMMDAKNGLNKIDENMAKLHQWINLAKVSHKSNEVKNTNLLARAYSDLTI